MGHFCEFTIAFMIFGGSSETGFFLHSMLSLHWKGSMMKLWTKPKLGREEIKLYDHIVRIIALLKIWLLQIEQGDCMGTNNRKHHDMN